MIRNLIVLIIVAFSQFSCSLAVEKDNSVDHRQPLTENSEIIPGAWQTEKYFPLLDGKAIALVGNHSSLVGDVHLV
ncbi:MAG: hypothetical protein K0B37_17170, partial [Bacteroidales bacterium]|nr:hypothetical protein [Bacteroidales bacterium]